MYCTRILYERILRILRVRTRILYSELRTYRKHIMNLEINCSLSSKFILRTISTLRTRAMNVH